MVGGTTWCSSDWIVTTSSIPPLAPKECPSWLLVLEILSRLRVILKDLFDGQGFGFVAQLRAGAMRIDIVDLGGPDSGILQGIGHGSRGTGAILVRLRDMPGIGTDAGPIHFAVDSCAAGLGVFEFFEHEQAGTFTEHKAVSIGIKRTAGTLPDHHCAWRAL